MTVRRGWWTGGWEGQGLEGKEGVGDGGWEGQGLEGKEGDGKDRALRVRRWMIMKHFFVHTSF